MLLFLGPTLIVFGLLIYLGRRRLYMRNLNNPEPSGETRAVAIRWNAFLGRALIVAGTIVTAAGAAKRI